MVKVLVLGGGYGTRLVRDIDNDQNETYKHLLNVPKALLPVGGIPLLTHWIKLFLKVEEIDHVYVETNAVFFDQFQTWSTQWPGFVSVVSDQTCSNESRLGAVAAMEFAWKHFNLDGDVVILAGDTLFYKDFNIDDVIERFQSLKTSDPKSSLVTVYECEKDAVSKHGILEVDANQRVTSFLEKPEADATSSRLACPCFYLLSNEALREVSKFLKEKEDASMSEKDAPGNYLNHLHKKLPVYTYKISGRFDVGGLSSYIQCIQYFSEQREA